MTRSRHNNDLIQNFIPSRMVSITTANHCIDWSIRGIDQFLIIKKPKTLVGITFRNAIVG